MQTAAAGAAEKVSAPGEDPEPPSHFVALGVVGSVVIADGALDASFGGEMVAGTFEPGGGSGADGSWLAGWAASGEARKSIRARAIR